MSQVEINKIFSTEPVINLIPCASRDFHLAIPYMFENRLQQSQMQAGLSGKSSKAMFSKDYLKANSMLLQRKTMNSQVASSNKMKQKLLQSHSKALSLKMKESNIYHIDDQRINHEESTNIRSELGLEGSEEVRKSHLKNSRMEKCVSKIRSINSVSSNKYSPTKSLTSNPKVCEFRQSNFNSTKLSLMEDADWQVKKYLNKVSNHNNGLNIKNYINLKNYNITSSDDFLEEKSHNDSYYLKLQKNNVVYVTKYGGISEANNHKILGNNAQKTNQEKLHYQQKVQQQKHSQEPNNLYFPINNNCCLNNYYKHYCSNILSFLEPTANRSTDSKGDNLPCQKTIDFREARISNDSMQRKAAINSNVSLFGFLKNLSKNNLIKGTFESGFLNNKRVSNIPYLLPSHQTLFKPIVSNIQSSLTLNNNKIPINTTLYDYNNSYFGSTMYNDSKKVINLSLNNQVISENLFPNKSNTYYSLNINSYQNDSTNKESLTLPTPVSPAFFSTCEPSNFYQKNVNSGINIDGVRSKHLDSNISERIISHFERLKSNNSNICELPMQKNDIQTTEITPITGTIIKTPKKSILKIKTQSESLKTIIKKEKVWEQYQNESIEERLEALNKMPEAETKKVIWKENIEEAKLFLFTDEPNTPEISKEEYKFIQEFINDCFSKES